MVKRSYVYSRHNEILDNVLDDFIKNAPESMKNAVYSAKMERSVGLGAMGFHSFLQSKNIPFESPLAKSWNIRIFQTLKKEADQHRFCFL